MVNAKVVLPMSKIFTNETPRPPTPLSVKFAQVDDRFRMLADRVRGKRRPSKKRPEPWGKEAIGGLILIAAITVGVVVAFHYWSTKILIMTAVLWFLTMVTRQPLFAIGGALLLLLPITQ